MLFGNKRRAMASSGGSVGVPAQVSVSGLAGDAAADTQGRREPVNRLLNRATIKQCPSEIKQIVGRSQLPSNFVGIGDALVWVVDEESREVVWWRYKSSSSLPPGRVRIHTCDRAKLRALIAYDIKQQHENGATESVPFLLVASVDGLEAIQLATLDHSAPHPPQFMSWAALKIEPGETTVLCVSADDNHSNVMLCNRAWELVVFRHDLSVPSLLEYEPDVFHNQSLATRLGMGSSSLGKTLGRFIGTEPSSVRPCAILCSRAGPSTMSRSRRTAPAGAQLISVTVLSKDDIYLWRLAAVDEERSKAEGFWRQDASATRSRSAFDGAAGAVVGSPSPSPVRQQSKLPAPARLMEVCMQSACSTNGKWGDACLQVLVQHGGKGAAGGDKHFVVHFLSPVDLESQRAPQLLPPLEVGVSPASGSGEGGAVAEAGSSGGPKLLPCTVSVDGREVCNVHASDGQRVLTVRAGGSDVQSDGLEADEDWHVGPLSRVVAAVPLLVARERHTHLVALTTETVVLLTPSNVDLRVQGMGEGERLQTALKKVTTAADLEAYLRELVQRAPEKAEQAAAHLAARGVGNLNVGHGDVRATDARVLLCVLVDQAQRQVLEAPVDSRFAAASASSVSEKSLLTLHLDDKERQLKHMRSRLEALMPEQSGVHEAMDRLSDRVRACSMLLHHPSLIPGGASVLAQAIQLTVNRKEWLGENALRPWAVAWRTFAQFSTRVPDVLLGLKSHLDQLLSATPPLPSLAAALAAAHNVCALVFDAALASSHVRSEGADGPRCSEVAAEEAEMLGVEHVVCLSSFHALGRVVVVVEELCAQCYAQAQAAGLGAEPRVLAIKETLVNLQALHLRVFDEGLQKRCFAKEHSEQVLEYGRACAIRYLDRWRREHLDCVPFRVRLAAQLAEVDTLVQVALHELSSRKEACEHNDRFATELKAARYAPRFLRALVDTYSADDERGSIWDPPFASYDFLHDLEEMLDEREAQCGPSNLGWIAQLRGREHCRRMVAGGVRSKDSKNYDEVASLSNAAHNMVRVGADAHVPDLHAHTALQSMARLASEASRRRTANWALPQNVSAVQLPIDTLVIGALANAAVQLRAGGVRAQDGTIVSSEMWDIQKTALRCVEGAEEIARVESSERATRQVGRDNKLRQQRLLQVYQRLMAVAAEANTIFSQDGAAGGGGGGQALALEKLLTIEALEASPARVLELCALQGRFGAPRRRSQLTAWPNSVQLRLLQQLSQNA